ncbi:hypothetical protein B0H11DRAFT_1939794 [Mycena galericulata]|nr:hypothetical protein B0H11DRAFT_1939794 [Mycena galericulata]
MPDTGDNYFDAHRFIGRDLHEAVLVKTVHDLVSTSSILDTILQTYDDDQLFRIALHSDDHWNIVSTYLAKATVQPTHPASTINSFTRRGPGSSSAVYGPPHVVRLQRDLQSDTLECKPSHRPVYEEDIRQDRAVLAQSTLHARSHRQLTLRVSDPPSPIPRVYCAWKYRR